MENVINVYDVCNTDLIYDKASGYVYSLSKEILEGFLSGKAFDNPQVYTEEEFKSLSKDINEIFQTILASNPIKANLAVISAGSPGAGKTVKMNQELKKKRELGENYAYVCPDDVCLQNQINTYRADIANSDNLSAGRLAAYNKWRPGSNAATHLILANLIREKYAFYFGSTSASPSSNKFFEFLKKQGYRIRLMHVTAPDDVRWESIKERDKTFIQTTPQDVKEKGLQLPQRITDTFLSFADEIDFYYRDSVKENAQLAAKWIHNADFSEALGTLQVLSPEDYQQIKTIHNVVTEVLKRPDLNWEVAVEKNSKIVLGN